MVHFSERLKELREKKNLKQSELGEMLGLGSAAISKYEKDVSQPDLGTLLKLSEIFAVSTDYLLGLSDSPDKIINDQKDFSLTNIKRIVTLYDEELVNRALNAGWILLQIIQYSDIHQDYGTMCQNSYPAFVLGNLKPKSEKPESNRTDGRY